MTELQQSQYQKLNELSDILNMKATKRRTVRTQIKLVRQWEKMLQDMKANFTDGVAKDVEKEYLEQLDELTKTCKKYIDFNKGNFFYKKTLFHNL